MTPILLKPLFTIGLFMLGFLLARLLLLAGQLHAQFGYTWPEAFQDAVRLLFDTTF